MSGRIGGVMLRVAAIVVGTAAAVVLVAAVGTLVLANSRWGHTVVRQMVLRGLRGPVHGIVRIGGVDGDLLDHVILTDVSIADSTGAPLIRVRRAAWRYHLVDVLHKRLAFFDVQLDHPTIALVQSQDSIWNYKRIFPASSQGPDTASGGFGSYITLSGVRITRGDLVVRSPWRPDSALSPAARDSAIRFALSSDSRVAVDQVSGGYEKTIAVHDLSATVPALQLADPAHPTKVAQVAAFAAQVAAFRPPEATVRDVVGVFYFDRDSLWWRQAKIQLPASLIAGGGTYGLNTGDLRLTLRATPAALSDVRFLYPSLPTDGSLGADIGVTWHGKTQDYVARNLQLRTGSARASGRLGVTMSDSVRFHDTDVTFSTVDTHLITEVAPAMQMPGHGTVSGHAVLAGPMSALKLNTDVRYDDDFAGSSRATVVGEVGVGDGFRARHLTITLAPLQVALARMARLSLPVGGTVVGQATLDSATAEVITGRLDLVHQDGSAITHLVASGDVGFATRSSTPSRTSRAASGAQSVKATGSSGSPRPGPERVDIEATVQPLDLTTVGKFIPAAHLHGRAGGDIRVSGLRRDLTIHSRLGLIGSPDSSGLTLDGHVDLDADTLGYDLTMVARLLDAQAVSTLAPPTAITATVSARGRGMRPASMTSTIAADASASSIDSIGVDSVHLRAAVRDGQLQVDTAHVRAMATRADISGSFGLAAGRAGTLNYRVTIDSLGRYQRFMPHDTSAVAPRPGLVAAAVAHARADSARQADTTDVQRAILRAPPPSLAVDTPHTIRRDTLAGRAVAIGTVQGDIHRFDVHGTLVVDSLIAVGNAARRVRASYQWIGGPDLDAPLAGEIQLDTASIAGFALDSLDARLTYRKPDGTLRLTVHQDPLRTYAVTTLFHYTPTDKTVSYDTLSFRFDTTVWRAPHPGSIEWGSKGLAVHQLELVDGRTGQILIDGVLAPRADTVGHLHATIRRFDVADLVALAEEAAPLHGHLSLDADLVGSTEDPHIRGTASLSDATIRTLVLPNVSVTYEYDTAALHAHAELAPQGAPASRFAVADATVPINLAVGATGPRLLDRPLRGDMKLDSLPLADVQQFLSSVANLGGRVSGHITVAGTGQHPSGVGALALDSGAATIVATGMVINSATARIHLTPDSVVIDSLVARTPSTGGRLRIAGTLDRSDPTISVVTATFVANNARVLDTRDRGRIDADANLTIAGPLAAPYVYGTSRVRDGVYYLEPDNGKNLIDLREPALYHVADTANPAIRNLIPAQTSMLSHLLMDVDLIINRDTWVRNESGNVEAYTDGPLTLHIDHVQQALVVNGTINTEIGEYTFMGKRFQITKGTATFIGTPRINPTLQASGEYAVPGSGREARVINITISGTLDSLRLALTSEDEPPISQSDLLSYLAFSQPTSGVAQTTSSSLSGSSQSGGIVGAASTFVEEQLAAQAVGVLTDQVKGNLGRALDADVLNIATENNYTDIAINKNNIATSFIQNTQLEFGKYFTPRTYVALQASVAPGARVVHRLGKGLSVQVSGEPLYLLGQPTLATTQTPALTEVLGFSLVKSWRF